jgi:hypothetical protein
VFAIAVPPIPIGVSSVFCDIVAPARLGHKAQMVISTRPLLAPEGSNGLDPDFQSGDPQ